MVIVVTVFICTSFLFCSLLLICYSAIQLLSRKCAIKLSVKTNEKLKCTHYVWYDRAERQSARMSKITSDGLTRGLAKMLYGNSGRQYVKIQQASLDPVWRP